MSLGTEMHKWLQHEWLSARPDKTESVLIRNITVKSTFHKTCMYVKNPERIKNKGKIYTENPSYCTHSLKKIPGTDVPSKMMMQNSKKLLSTWSMLENRTGNAVYWENNNYENGAFLQRSPMEDA